MTNYTNVKMSCRPKVISTKCRFDQKTAVLRFVYTGNDAHILSHQNHSLSDVENNNFLSEIFILFFFWLNRFQAEIQNEESLIRLYSVR